MGVRVEAMQAVLMRLLQDVVSAESRLDHSRADQLAAVNEQLLVSALTSRVEAEDAAQALQEAARSAMLDALTGLPNRATLRDHFTQALASARRHHGRCALLFIDLDDFKQINDRHGHGFGDLVLKEVAGRLVGAVREVDTVGRHGGDEFVVLLAELGQPGDVEGVAGKLVAAIGAPAEIDGQPVRVNASVGAAVCPDDGEDFDTLLRHADAAMYASKRRRTGGAGPHSRAAAAHAGPDRTDEATRGAAETQRRFAELREANEKLVLAALDAQELRAAAEQARERQAAFLAAVADELRDPMAPIRIAITMLGRPPADEPLLPRVQQVVEQQIGRISRLVDAINVEGGGVPIDRRRVDIAQVVDAAVATLEPAMMARQQRFTLRRPPGAIEVQGDPKRLELVVFNLLDNACRYTHDGGRIELAIDADTDSVIIAITDNGIGITPELLPQVFEPFVQDPQALAPSGGGMGIGLTVARALVRGHGGRITAHSAGFSRGSRFVITLPRAPAATDPPAVPPDAGAAGAER